MYSIRQRGKLLRTLTNADLAVPRYDAALRALLDVKDDRLLRLRKIARLKIIDVFARPELVVEWPSKRQTVIRTENYVHGIKGTVPALVNYMLHHIKKWHGFANLNDVWEPLRGGTKAQRRATLAEVHEILITEALTVLVGTDAEPGVLLYMEGSCDWVAPPSLIDEYDQLRDEIWQRRAKKPGRKGKADIRCLHGRDPSARNLPGQVQLVAVSRHGQMN